MTDVWMFLFDCLFVFSHFFHSYLVLDGYPGQNAYPHKFDVGMSIPNFRALYDHLKNGEQLKDVECTLAGRLMSVRSFGKLTFYTLQADGAQIQIMADERYVND
jgi:lysyl-tRNA synthetase class II